MNRLRILPGCLGILLFGFGLIISGPSNAAAGRVVFTSGHVVAENQAGEIRRITKRSRVEAGDTLRTSSNSIIQVRMIDKAFISLRSNSEVLIEDYKIGAKKEEDVGIFALIKGGLRAITGIIGKRLNSAYKMRTVTGTIGIRGTDYTARLCNMDCDQGVANLAGGGVENGLYVGVNEGGLTLFNALGEIDLDELQYGFIKNATTAPIALLSAPEFLYFNSRPPDPEAGESSDSGAGPGDQGTAAARSGLGPESADVTSDPDIREGLGAEQVKISEEQIRSNLLIDTIAVTESGDEFSLTDGTIESGRMIVISYGIGGAPGSFTAVTPNPHSSIEIGSSGLQEFENGFIGGGSGIYKPGSAAEIDLGYDPVTKIAWGRWHNGSAIYTNAAGNVSSIDLTNTSLHWMAGPTQTANIALPSSGSASYRLIGNTSPTDNYGNTGVLGSATLNANFTNMTVNTSLALGINGHVWNGSGAGLPISGNGNFGGALSVDVDSGSFSGSGSAAGFFTNDGAGAGMGYALEADISGSPTTVTGNAVFQQ